MQIHSLDSQPGHTIDDLVRAHYLERDQSPPETPQHDGFILREEGQGTVHVSIEGALVAFVLAAARLPESLAPTASRNDDANDPFWVNVLEHSGMLERTEVDATSGLLLLRRWIDVGQLDHAGFSAAVHSLRKRARLWQLTLNLEAA